MLISRTIRSKIAILGFGSTCDLKHFFVCLFLKTCYGDRVISADFHYLPQFNIYNLLSSKKVILACILLRFLW